MACGGQLGCGGKTRESVGADCRTHMLMNRSVQTQKLDKNSARERIRTKAQETLLPSKKDVPSVGKRGKHVNTESRKVMGRIQMESQHDDDETKTKDESERVTHKYICL